MGFRNPFRFSFDRQTGQLWVGDVGQNAFEEIDIVTQGRQLRMAAHSKATTRNPNRITSLARARTHTPPIYEYDHSDRLAVIGGYVYRGSQIASLFGKYLYTDYRLRHVSGRSTRTATNNASLATATQARRRSAKTTTANSTSCRRTAASFRLTEPAVAAAQPTLLSQTGLFTNLANADAGVRA